MVAAPSLIANALTLVQSFAYMKTVIFLKHRSDYNKPDLAVSERLYIALRILSKFLSVLKILFPAPCLSHPSQLLLSSLNELRALLRTDGALSGLLAFPV